MTRAEFLACTGNMPSRQRKAAWTLQKLVECNAQSFATQDFDKRRRAALKATRANIGGQS